MVYINIMIFINIIINVKMLIYDVRYVINIFNIIIGYLSKIFGKKLFEY